MPASDLPLLIEAAEAGAQIAMRFWKTGQSVWHKEEGAGPVSEGDYAVDKLLHEHLRTARPDYGWLSEETPDSPERLNRRRVFVVDPIDGTRAYVEGHENWALSLAVVEDGRPTAGVVAMPAKGRVYAAARGQGATRDGTAIHCSDRADLAGATLMAPRPSLDPAHWPGGVPPVERRFRPSLAYRLALVAEGRYDAMLTFRAVWEWDVAAGALIAAEAGASVTDRWGQPLILNSPDGRTPGVLAAGPSMHAALLARMT